MINRHAGIIQKIQSKGSVVLLLGVRGGVLNDKFDTEFEKISSKYHTAYVSDVLSGLITNMQYMSDAVHPNDLGYQKIADRVYPVLVNLIKK
jgi:lysophospholipase L1-like esterase